MPLCHRRRRAGISHLVAPCMTSAAEMLGSTASLAAGWAGTSDTGGRGRREEITAGRPQLAWPAQLSDGGPAVRTTKPGCCNNRQAAWRLAALKHHSAAPPEHLLPQAALCSHHTNTTDTQSVCFWQAHHICSSAQRTFNPIGTCSDNPSHFCQPCWFAQVPSDWPRLGRPGCLCSRLPCSVGLQLGHLPLKLLALLGNRAI